MNSTIQHLKNLAENWAFYRRVQPCTADPAFVKPLESLGANVNRMGNTYQIDYGNTVWILSKVGNRLWSAHQLAPREVHQHHVPEEDVEALISDGVKAL